MTDLFICRRTLAGSDEGTRYFHYEEIEPYTRTTDESYASLDDFRLQEIACLKSRIEELEDRANQVEEVKWLPIESAPRDGTLVMGWWPNMRIDQYPCAVFYDQGVYQNPKAWSLASNLEYGEVYPTKFMPLSKPPSNIISEEKGE